MTEKDRGDFGDLDLPEELPETPYSTFAFRVIHRHSIDDDDPEYPGTIVVEVAAELPDTDTRVVVPFEMSLEQAMQLVSEVSHNARLIMLEGELCEEDDEEDDRDR